MTTAVVLFTRDLRIHDHPALAAAVDRADRIVPLFVLDARILRSRYASPNRVAHLLEALQDLRTSLRRRGGTLVVRQGDVAEQVRAICVEVAADDLHLSADVSTYAERREAALRRVTDDLGVVLHQHPGVTVVPPGELVPSGSAGRTREGAAGRPGDPQGHFRVFTPYWRRWVEHDHPIPVPVPALVAVPDGLEEGPIPQRRAVVDGDVAPERQPGGESVARVALDAWFADGIERYDDDRDRLARVGTSRLSAALHLGTISPREIAGRVDRRRRGQEGFLRQLCWRDFNHQLFAARPDLATADLRSQGDDWRNATDDPDGLAAWKEGRTGYPVVDAAMRQLVREGYVHNRARMLAAAFLTKHLRINWRLGAWHFMDHLEDGDLVNNFAGWQWAAGTGPDSRPNRMFNPVTQGRRYDPDGTYVRRYIPELRDVDVATIHAPWEADGTLLEGAYPAPIVDHGMARDRFLTERGRR